jgi:hypothetical protein
VVAALTASMEGVLPAAITASPSLHQFRRQRRQPIDLIVGPDSCNGGMIPRFRHAVSD